MTLSATRKLVTITHAADAYISNILRSNPGKAMRAGYDDRGCSGHKYTFELMDDSSIGTFDERIDISHGFVIIPSENTLGLVGSTLDLKVDMFEQHLEWNNPLAVNHCGCGASFQLPGDAACKS